MHEFHQCENRCRFSPSGTARNIRLGWERERSSVVSEGNPLFRIDACIAGAARRIRDYLWIQITWQWLGETKAAG